MKNQKPQKTKKPTTSPTKSFALIMAALSELNGRVKKLEACQHSSDLDKKIEALVSSVHDSFIGLSNRLASIFDVNTDIQKVNRKDEVAKFVLAALIAKYDNPVTNVIQPLTARAYLYAQEMEVARLKNHDNARRSYGNQGDEEPSC